ncbi:tetratricopeptide repeat protein [Micromonospora sp. LOL_013]|uniref:tetratricopeptide repeat protein n=1 Tax=unclassified Micromonospora TaxID=2617518 RepID=UPI003A8B5379
MLEAVFDAAVAAGLRSEALHLTQVTYTYLDRRGHWSALTVLQRSALQLSLSLLRERQERHREALAHGRTAYEFYAAAGDRRGEGKALNVVGWQHAQLGEYAETLDWCGRALRLLREFGDGPGQATTWHSLGYAYQHLGDPDESAEPAELVGPAGVPVTRDGVDAASGWCKHRTPMFALTSPG